MPERMANQRKLQVLVPAGHRQADERLDSWKEIAAYLKRGPRTVQRWEHEDEGEGIRRDHEQRGDAESQQRPGMAGQLLLGADPAARQQPVPGDEPPEPGEDGERDQRGRGRSPRAHRCVRPRRPMVEPRAPSRKPGWSCARSAAVGRPFVEQARARPASRPSPRSESATDPTSATTSRVARQRAS